MGPISSSETSVLSQPVLCNSPEDGRIQLYVISDFHDIRAENVSCVTVRNVVRAY